MNNYKPKLLIQYDRIAYTDDATSLRITIDKNIKTTTDCNCFFDKFETESDERCILEIKSYQGLPEKLDSKIKSMKLKEIKKSKFATYS